MRTLFTCQAATGHFHSIIPVAAALTAAGHEVACCSSPSFRAQVEPWGFSYFGIGPEADEMRVGLPERPPPGRDAYRWTQRYWFAGASAQKRFPDLLALAGEWQPDVIIRENSEYAGCLVAETLGIPHASVATGAWSALESFMKPNLAESLADRRAEVGLPPDPRMEMLFRYLHLCFMHPRFDGPDAVFPPTAHFLRHDSPHRSDESLPSWVDELDDRPLVLASLGTIFHQTPGLLEAILAGVGDGDVNLVLVCGRGQDPARFGAQPDHVRIEPYVAQRLLLPRCDLFITHGGFNSVKEALSVGVPLVVVPIAGDQFYCAERCAALGVAQVIEPDHRSSEFIADAVRTVLGDSRHQTNAAQIQADMAALPAPEHAVELLERLVTSRQPLNRS